MENDTPENKGQTPETGQTGHLEETPVLALVPESEEQKAEREGKEEQERTTLAKERFIEAFRETVGIVELACKRAGIARQTYYDWVKKDPEFKALRDQVLEEQLDYVEGIFLASIHAGNIKSVHFYLDRKHPRYVKQIVAKGEVKSIEDLLDEWDALEQSQSTPIKGHAENKPGANAPATADTHEARADSAVSPQ